MRLQLAFLVIFIISGVVLGKFNFRNVNVDESVENRLKVTFKGEEKAQLSLHLVVRGDEKRETYMAGKYEDGTYQFVERISTIQEELGNVEGVCDIYAMVGNSKTNEYDKIGEFVLHPVEGATFLVREKPYGIKQELHHTFREPETRALDFTSTVFSAITIAPVPLLIMVLFLSGGNIRHLVNPMGGFKQAFYSLGFSISLFMILWLMVLFWIQLNLVQTLLTLIPLMGSLLFFAYKSLRYQPISQNS